MASRLEKDHVLEILRPYTVSNGGAAKTEEVKILALRRRLSELDCVREDILDEGNCQ
jgi:hypothetical protein